jgi:hypothetical protein
MTANQINYAKHLEDVRTHKANEEIGRRQAAAAESQASSAARNVEIQARNTEIQAMNAETNALNAATNQSAVGAQWYGAQANAAYQTAMAAVSEQQAKEAARHNQAAESNDLIKSGRETTAKNYATQKQYEQSTYSTDKHFEEVQLQTRAQLITGLANMIPSIAKSGLKLMGVGG